MGVERDANGEKWCTYGGGHWTDTGSFYCNRTKPDGLNDTCNYHRGKVDANG